MCWQTLFAVLIEQCVIAAAIIVSNDTSITVSIVAPITYAHISTITTNNVVASINNITICALLNAINTFRVVSVTSWLQYIA